MICVCGHGKHLHRFDDPPSKPPRKHRYCTVGVGRNLTPCGCRQFVEAA